MANGQYRVDDDGNGGSFLMGLLTGAAIGAGVAMLFAPKPGREIRRDLGEHADKFATDASKTYRRASDTTAEWARRASDAAGDVAERGKELYNQARDAVAKGADEAQRYRQETAAAVGSFTQGGSTGPRPA
jgi:gas vesicle protein